MARQASSVIIEKHKYEIYQRCNASISSLSLLLSTVTTVCYCLLCYLLLAHHQPLPVCFVLSQVHIPSLQRGAGRLIAPCAGRSLLWCT